MPIAPMPDTNSFYTLETLGSLTGASGATFVVANGLQRAFNFNPRWLALAIAEAICIGGAAFTTSGRLSDYCVAIVNGFLVFSTAAGATSIAAPKATSAAAPPAPGGPAVHQAAR